MDASPESVLRVLQISGDVVATLAEQQLQELVMLARDGDSIWTLKRHLQPLLRGVSIYRMKLVLNNGFAGEVIEHQRLTDLKLPMDLTVILVQYALPTIHQTQRLRMAAEEGHETDLQELLSVPINPDSVTEDEFPPFWVVCAEGHVECARLLLDAGVNINKVCDHGQSPLWVACQRGHLEVARLLIAAGANKDQQNLYGKSPLWHACANGSQELARLLLDVGANKDLRDQHGRSPMSAAAEFGNVDIVRMLLEAKSDKDSMDQQSRSPVASVSMALLNHHFQVAQVLIDAGASTSHLNHAEVEKLKREVRG